MTLTVPLFAQDQSYPSWLMRRMLQSLATPGVVDEGDFVVSPSSGLQVAVTAGDAYVPQTIESTEPLAADIGCYYVYSDANASPFNTIIAPVSNKRWDLVVLRVYDITEQHLSGSSKAQIEWVVGTESAAATLTNLSGIASAPANSLVLANVLQTVGEVSISSGNIVNFGTWQPLIMGTGGGTPFAPLGAPGMVPACKRVKDEIHLCGQAQTTGSVANGNTFFILPNSSFFPGTTQAQLNLVGSTGATYVPFRLVVAAGAGAMTYGGPSETSFEVCLDGQSFRVT